MAREAALGEKAGDETRTRDIFLGKEVLYQLSYTRGEKKDSYFARAYTGFKFFFDQLLSARLCKLPARSARPKTMAPGETKAILGVILSLTDRKEISFPILHYSFLNYE
jgi:hypothetical protein